MDLPLSTKPSQNVGFTLIEMSLVLVIIGLVVGGMLTGQALIDAAGQRAQISQIEKYNVAVRTFQAKYQYLPGDIPDPSASNFGFLARGTLDGQGDGNGVLQGNCSGNPGSADGIKDGCGELAVFWEDLSTAQLLDGTIAYLGPNYPHQWPPAITITLSSTPNLSAWLPAAKIGGGNFVSLYSYAGVNYFTVSALTALFWYTTSASNPGITVQQAYQIDSKIDDGLPQSGNVTVCYANYAVTPSGIGWAAGGGLQGVSGSEIYGSTMNDSCVVTTAATPYASTNCYDNNTVAGTQKYQMQNAALPNCALSFAFQ